MKDHVVDHEPDTALFVPNDNPLLFYKVIALYAKDHLVPKGSLFFEIHEKLSEEIKSFLKDYGFSKVTVKKDLQGDRKSTRLNSSHVRISYAVFCLKKKKDS